MLDRNQARMVADALLEPGRRQLARARAARARRSMEMAVRQRRAGGAMAGFGIGAVAGQLLFDSASPMNFLGMALGFGIVYFVQRRGASSRPPQE